MTILPLVLNPHLLVRFFTTWIADATTKSRSLARQIIELGTEYTDAQGIGEKQPERSM
jgi:Na+(H+)/acetate symporter ActP